MTCPCGHHFCWYCFRDHPSGTIKRVYHLHTIPECAFIFISKIFLVLACMISVLVTFNGNWIIKSIFGIMSTIFSIVWRAAMLDGFILAQVFYFMMRKRRGFYMINDIKKYVVLTIIINTMYIAGLYYFD